jgi:hypothetical protein
MMQNHYDYCAKVLGYVPEKYEIWGVSDMDVYSSDHVTEKLEEEKPFAEIKYQEISSKIDDMLKRLNIGKGEEGAL